MKTLLAFCASLALSVLILPAQTSWTKTFNFPAGGEYRDAAVSFNGGYLITSAYYGNSNGTIENVIRKVNVHDSVERSIRFGDDFHHYFHPVVTTDNRIFVFGVKTFSTSTEVNYVVMDSMFNILQEKKLQVPYPIIFSKFFKAKDGGVIGSVHEVCDESRIFRLDADGNLVWIESYVAIVSPPGGYDKTVITSINLFGGNRYLLAGHLGFGYGTFYFTIDDNGTILNSLTIENFFTGYNSDAMWRTAFDGEKLLAAIDNATNGQDTTFLVEVDTGLNLLNVKRLIHSDDSTAQPRELFATPTEFITVFAVAVYAPFNNVRVAITGYDKTTLQPNWTIETRCDGAQDPSFYFFDGALSPSGEPVYMYNYGPIVFAPNGGNNYGSWGMTKLDPVSHDGFCDGQQAAVTCTTGSYVVTPYYMITIAHPVCTVVNATHATVTVGLGTPTLQCGFTIGMDEAGISDALMMYPNPTDGIVHLNQFCSVLVADVNGKEILSANSTNVIDLSSAASGVYFVTVIDAEGNVLQRSKVIRE